MANADRPRGFQPHGPVLRVTPYTADGTIYPGDMCVLEADGKVVVAAAGDGVQLVGAAANYAVQGGEVRIYDHPDQQFECQADSTELTSVAFVGDSANIVATAGDSTYKQSRQELDSSDAGSATATAQLRIVKLQPGPQNAWGTNCDIVVRINQHEYVDGTAV